MSHTTRPADTPAGQPQSRMQNVQPTEMSGWVGWIAFAGVMMLLVGSFHIIQGLVVLLVSADLLVVYLWRLRRKLPGGGRKRRAAAADEQAVRA